jgi:hypothetical protein
MPAKPPEATGYGPLGDALRRLAARCAARRRRQRRRAVRRGCGDPARPDRRRRPVEPCDGGCLGMPRAAAGSRGGNRGSDEPGLVRRAAVGPSLAAGLSAAGLDEGPRGRRQSRCGRCRSWRARRIGGRTAAGATPAGLRLAGHPDVGRFSGSIAGRRPTGSARVVMTCSTGRFGSRSSTVARPDPRLACGGRAAASARPRVRLPGGSPRGARPPAPRPRRTGPAGQPARRHGSRTRRVADG